MLTSPPPSVVAVRFCVVSQCRSAMSWVFPGCGVASSLPFSCAGEVIPGLTTSAAPPEVEPAITRIPSPLDWM